MSGRSLTTTIGCPASITPEPLTLRGEIGSVLCLVALGRSAGLNERLDFCVVLLGLLADWTLRSLRAEPAEQASEVDGCLDVDPSGATNGCEDGLDGVLRRSCCDRLGKPAILLEGRIRP